MLDIHPVLKRRELPGFARVNKVTSASLGYPLLVFNKTLLSNKKKDTHHQFSIKTLLSNKQQNTKAGVRDTAFSKKNAVHVRFGY